MRKVIAGLLAFLLLPASIASAITPADYTGCIFWLQTAYPAHMWSGASIGAGSNPVNDGDLVRTIEGKVGGFTLTQSSGDNFRLLYRPGGSRIALHTGAQGGFNRYIAVSSSQASFNFHVTGTGTICFYVKFDNTSAAATEVILDSRKSANANRGWTVARNTSEQLQLAMSRGGTNIISLNTGATTITDTNYHRVVIRIATGANNTTIELDGANAATGTLGTLDTMDATDNLHIGISSALASNADCQVSDVVLLNQVIAAGDATHFASWNPPVGGPSTFKPRAISF